MGEVAPTRARHGRRRWARGARNRVRPNPRLPRSGPLGGPRRPRSSDAASLQDCIALRQQTHDIFARGDFVTVVAPHSCAFFCA